MQVNQSSIISPLAARAIHIHQKIQDHISYYIFVFTIPDDNLISLERRPWSWKLIPWCISFTVITGLLALGSCLFVAITQILDLPVKAQPPLHNTVIIVGMGICITLQLIAVSGGIINPVIFKNFRAFLEFDKKCVAALPPDIRHERRTDILGMFYACLTTSSALCTPTAVPVAILTQLDPFYYLFEEFLPHPYHRPIWLIIGVPLFRMILMWFFLFDVIHFVCMFLFLFLPPVFAIVSSTQHLSKIYGERCLRLYVELRVHFAQLDRLIRNMAVVLVAFAQVGTVTICWLVIECGNYLSIYIVIPFCIIILYTIVMSVLLLRATETLRSETKKLIRVKLNLHYCTNYVDKSKRYYYSLWKAQESLYFKCGSFFPFQYGITRKYMYELVNNLANAVILIKPS